MAAVAALATVARPDEATPAADTPETTDDAWVALDISASMNNDVICTPAEWRRCVELYRYDRYLGDENGDRRGRRIDRANVPSVVFGGHRMGTYHSTLAYLVEGGRYLDFRGRVDRRRKLITVGTGQGIPRSGRIGIFRLHVDELEHADCAVSTGSASRMGRNAIRFGHDPTQERPAIVDVPIAPVQQGRYAVVNLLFAGSIGNLHHWGTNRLRLSARYEDGTSREIWRGHMGFVRGRSRGDEVDYRLPENQVEALSMTLSATSGGSPTQPVIGIQEAGWGKVAMLRFERPLPLDPSRRLVGFTFEEADGAGRGYWDADIFAISVRPAE